MKQPINIFENNRVMRLYEKAFYTYTNETIPVVDIRNVKVLEEYVSNFLNNPQLLEIHFLCRNKEYVLAEFRNMFRYIEAAGGLVYNDKDELLLIYRLGKIDLPKGKIENNEIPTEAAIREVTEECGIKNLTIKEELNPSFHMYKLNAEYVLKKTFWYQMQYTGKEQAKAQTEEGIVKVEWAAKSNLSKYANKTYASLKHFFN
jgi:8-oxo-dGTP pyrophosphatase MutT (NUDIX family)